MKTKRLQFLFFIIIIYALSACAGVANTHIEDEKEPIQIEPLKVETEKPVIQAPTIAPQPPTYISLVAVGDIMVHRPQILAQYDARTNTYDFNNNFDLVAPYIQVADLAIANLETTFGGETRGYSGYPNFNTPDALASALKKAGFDVISTINNHTFDTGASGFDRTLDVLIENDLLPIGSKKTEEDLSFHIERINDITIGFTAYSYETPRFGSLKTLNGIVIPEAYGHLMDTFNYNNLSEDLLHMEERIQKMKSLGSEVIVFYLHWGNEYQTTPSSYQTYLAHALCNLGVDVIIGSHPHVLQPLEFIKSDDGQHETFVAYSLGNFISNQRYEYLNTRLTEDGVVLTIDFIKDPNEQEVKISKVTYLPTWVNRYYENNQWHYKIIPLPEALEAPSEYTLSNSETLWRAQNALENINHILFSEDTRIQKQIASP